MALKHGRYHRQMRSWIAESDPLPPEDHCPLEDHRPLADHCSFPGPMDVDNITSTETDAYGEALANAEKSAWIEQVYREQGTTLVRYAQRFALAHRAGDIVHTVFARLVLRAGSAQGEIASPRAYLRKGVRNLARDEARSAQRRSAHLQVSCEDIELAGPDPVVALEARDMLSRLEAVIARLDPRTREIFLAHRIDGYSYAEIAQRAGLSVKTVEKHMSRAIAVIARHVEV